MVKRRCPGCGKVHSKRTCPHCLYTPFQETEFLTSSNRIWGEVPDNPPPRDPRRVSTVPQWQRKSAGSRRGSRKTGKKTGVSKLAWIIILISMLPSLLGILVGVTEDILSDVTVAHRETVPAPPPVDGVPLLMEEGLSIVADWSNEPIDTDIRVVVTNTSGRDLTVTTQGVAVNGCMYDDIFLYCEAPDGEQSEGWLWIDREDLAEATGMETIHNLTLRLEIYDEDYIQRYPMSQVILNAPGGNGYVENLDRGDQILWDRDGFRLSYGTFAVTEDGEWVYTLLAENHTNQVLEFYTSEVMLNGEGSGCWLGQVMLPQTQALVQLRLYDPESFADTPSQITQVAFSLEGCLGEQAQTYFETDLLTFEPG